MNPRLVNCRMRTVIAVAAAICLPLSALAVVPATWVHTTESDWAEGSFERTAVTSHGDLQLARKIELLGAADELPAIVSGVVHLDGEIYAASGTDGRIFRVAGDKTAELATLPSTLVGCLIADGRDLLAGGCGTKPGLYRVSPTGEVTAVWKNVDPKVHYVWAFVPAARGGYYVGTGPGAGVFHVDGQGTGRRVYEMSALASNVLALALSPDGTLHAGTDKEGLVFAINPQAGTGRVVLDTDESEIAAIVPDGAGGIYVATADQAKASGTIEPAKEKTGRADTTGQQAPTKKDADTAEDGQPGKSGESGATEEESARPGDEDAGPNGPDGDTAGADGGADGQNGADADRPASDAGDGQGAGDADSAPGADADGSANDDGSSGGRGEDDQTGAAGSRTAGEAGRSAEGAETAGDNAETGEATEAGDAAAEDAAEQAGDGQPTERARQNAETDQPVNKARGNKPAPATGSAVNGKGNAVYHVDAQGLITELAREPVAFLSMVRHGRDLLLGTGPEGKVYRLGVDGDLSVMLADLESKRITSLALQQGGALVVAAANPGAVARLSSGFAEDGTYTSKPLDARQIARWGTARASAKVPPGTSVTLATRSGNVADPEDKTWSSWSDEAAVGDGYVSLTSPAARFLQYRLTFHAAAGAAPELNRLELIYQVGNLAPTVTAIDVSTTPQENRRRVEPGAGYPKRYVQIAASDTNGDELVWDLYLRPVDVEDWLRVAKNLTEPKYTWDARTAPDGRYEMRVVVSDAPSNPPSRQLRGARISEPFLVDNTAPELNDLGARTGPGGVKLRGVAVDRTSRITDIQFSVDSGQTWQAAAPVDGICDSNREAFSVTIPDMEAGRHRITVKVLDELNNVGYGYAEVTVPEK